MCSKRNLLLALSLLLSNFLSLNSPVAAQYEITKTAVRDENSLSKPVYPNANYFKRLPRKPVRVIVSLGGGGCKSVAQIGVLRTLEKNHIPIDGILGTSMGAAVGALYCSGYTTDEIEQMFLSGEIQRAANVNLRLKAAMHSVSSILCKMHIKRHCAGLSSGRGYLALLKKKLPADFDALKIPFGAVATNLTDGQAEVLSKGSLPQSVLASNAVPAIIRPVPIGNKLYVDGGLKANLPVQMATDNDRDIVIAVTVDTAIGPESNEKFRSIGSIISRVSDIVLAASDKQQARHADVLIYPNCDRIPILSKDKELLKQGLSAGEKEAERWIPEIKKLLVEREVPVQASRSTASR